MEPDFEQLYNTYYVRVYSFILSLSKNREVSEEITQKTFFRALTKREQYHGAASELTWLCAIAKNLLTDELRIQNKAIALREETGEPLEHTIADADAAFQMHQILHTLAEPYKEVFQLRVFGELSFQKIAKLFNKTENWARVTYHRARIQIQERMDER